MHNYQQRNFAEIINESPCFWRDISSQYYRQIQFSRTRDNKISLADAQIQPYANFQDASSDDHETFDIQQHTDRSPAKKKRDVKNHKRDKAQFDMNEGDSDSEVFDSQSKNKRQKTKKNSQKANLVSSFMIQRYLNQLDVKQPITNENYRCGPLFSFCDYYQDAVNDLASYADPKDQEETELLRKNLILDPHIQSIATHSTKLLGYNLSNIEPSENYSPDFFINHQLQNNEVNISIDDQLQWLMKEQDIARDQVERSIQSLEEKILVIQNEDALKHQELQKQNGTLKEHFIQTLITLETKQIAESIMRIKARKPVRKNPKPLPALFEKGRFIKVGLPLEDVGFDYLIEFDKCLKIPDTWISDKELACLNSLREEIISSSRQQGPLQSSRSSTMDLESLSHKQQKSQKGKKNGRKNGLGFLSENTEVNELGFCHHCKQMKTTYVMSKCNYNSKVHGLYLPIQQVINGVQLHNVEPSQTSLVNHIILNKVIQDKKKRKCLEQELEFSCSKSYCSFCLKNCYEIMLQDSQNDKNWVCPYCMGQCYCSRCMRQDQLTKVRAYLISLAINEINRHQKKPSKVLSCLSKSQNFIDQIIKRNFDRIVRASSLAPYAQNLISLNFDATSVPLFMNTLNLDNQSHYLFKEDCKYAKVIAQQKKLKDSYEDLERKEYEKMSQIRNECEQLVYQIESKSICQVQDNNSSSSSSKSSKRRNQKHEEKQAKKKTKNAFLCSAFLDEISSPSFKRSPIHYSSIKSSTTASSKDIAKKSAEVDSLIKMKQPKHQQEKKTPKQKNPKKKNSSSLKKGNVIEKSGKRAKGSTLNI